MLIFNSKCTKSQTTVLSLFHQIIQVDVVETLETGADDEIDDEKMDVQVAKVAAEAALNFGVKADVDETAGKDLQLGLVSKEVSDSSKVACENPSGKATFISRCMKFSFR